MHATAARFHADAEAVKAYRQAMPDASPARLRTAILGDGLFRTRTKKPDRGVRHPRTAWAYVFTWRYTALNGQLGASHVMDLPFVFDQLHLPALHGPQALLGDTTPPRNSPPACTRPGSVSRPLETPAGPDTPHPNSSDQLTRASTPSDADIATLPRRWSAHHCRNSGWSADNPSTSAYGSDHKVTRVLRY